MRAKTATSFCRAVADEIHSYISGATSPGVTLQGTLMNHTKTMLSVDAHTKEYDAIFPGARAAGGKGSDKTPPLIFGETNSLYNQGKPGLSNSFGAALWGVDFNLYSASEGFKRVHMHQGTNYRVRLDTSRMQGEELT